MTEASGILLQHVCMVLPAPALCEDLLQYIQISAGKQARSWQKGETEEEKEMGVQSIGWVIAAEAGDQTSKSKSEG